MKEVAHVKVLIEHDTYKRFVLLARDRGMKIGAYVGLLIEQEVSSQGLLHNLPPFSKPFGVPVAPALQEAGNSPNENAVESERKQSRADNPISHGLSGDGRFSSSGKEGA